MDIYFTLTFLNVFHISNILMPPPTQKFKNLHVTKIVSHEGHLKMFLIKIKTPTKSLPKIGFSVLEKLAKLVAGPD